MKSIRFICLLSLFIVPLALTGCPGGGTTDESCTDAVKNQTETDVDCGGTCSACGNGQSCLVNGDCVSANCDNGTCTSGGASCSDNERNGNETDVDCGGSCSGCANGLNCASNADCQSAYCDGGTCADSPNETCVDNTQNQDETDVDCGGNVCTPCDIGDSCLVHSDCSSGNCDNEICADAPGCVDDNDCDANASCQDVAGNMECVCDAGYTGNGLTCSDIDECTAGSDDCDANATCTNNDGGFDCACDAGYTGDGVTCTDVDECTDGTDNCDANATCTNEVGSFSCACNAGYNGDGVTCTAMQACADNGDCDANATCEDVGGAMVCICAAGYQGDGATCTDVDECTDGTDNCDINATCTNNDGGFDCACNAGYTGDGVTCISLETCVDNNDCGTNATCQDVGGFMLCVCSTGYTGDGQTCTDVDECTAGTDNCDLDANCTNTDGSFSCACIAGYSGDGVTCTDIDECTDGTDNCHAEATCTNEDGSFTCACNAGYTGNGVTCTDVDECTDGTDNCHANASCTNTQGSFTCACDAGYTGNGVTCTDIDECATGADNCHANASCTNTAGSFTCACDAGYTGNGVSCTDINECTAGTDNCDANATCTNVAGSFTCACNAGYSGNGVTCVPDITDYFWTGVDQNVPEATLLNGGWNLCHVDTFGASGTPLSTIINNCDGDLLAMACRPVGNPNLTLAAMDEREDVLFDCANNNSCVHDGDNGVGWYYSDVYSWGFAPAGEAVNRGSCDVGATLPEQRMCIHTNSGSLSSGYRCGSTTLNGNNGWERLIYTRDRIDHEWAGVDQNVPETDLLFGGWEQCYAGTYNLTVPIAPILAACSGNKLAMACRPVGDPNLTLVAMDDRTDVLWECGTDSSCVHDGGNGVGWYYSNVHSWGFAPAGEAVQRTSCDVNGTLPEQRMCIHAGGGNIESGYRCGTTTLNGNASWERIIYKKTSNWADNGTGSGVLYQYNVVDTVQVRALKACESHFGVGNCCVITGGYQDMQYGECGGGGAAGTFHWHWDNHPVSGHCAPYYGIGDVLSPGWCGPIMGNFLELIRGQYGNVAPLPSDGSASPNFLLGSQLVVPQDSTLVNFGVDIRVAGPQMKLALYTESGGEPGVLVAETAPRAMVVGVTEIHTDAIPLPAGNYWIMAVYDATASVGFESGGAWEVKYISHTFASALPANYPAATTYTGQRFNYYITVME